MAFNPSAAFSYLDKAEEALDGLQGWLDNTFNSIGSYGQEGVDAVCSWSGEWASYKIAQVEAMVVKGLHGAYQGALDHIAIGGPLYNIAMGKVNLADIGALATAIIKIASPWIPPTMAAIQTMTQVPVKVVNIASKVNNLAGYKPPVNNPGITFSNFKIRAKGISMGDVVSGNFQVPAPPQPFTSHMKVAVGRTKERIAMERAEAGQTTSFKEAIGIKNKTNDGTRLA